VSELSYRVELLTQEVIDLHAALGTRDATNVELREKFLLIQDEVKELRE
jgi:uncharacterized small protein (DUF1192 family)